MQAAHMLVRDAMSRGILCVEPAMSVADALDFAHEHSIAHLPVVSGGRPLGIICTCDLEEASVADDVSAVMHAPPADTAPDLPLEDAARLMAKLCIGSLLVRSNEELVGIVTRYDVEKAGLAESAFADQRCSACHTFQHVHFNSKKGIWLCASCSRRSMAPPAMTELGNGD